MNFSLFQLNIEQISFPTALFPSLVMLKTIFSSKSSFNVFKWFVQTTYLTHFRDAQAIHDTALHKNRIFFVIQSQFQLFVQ